MVVVAAENADCHGVPLTVDGDRALARAYGFRHTKDGGYPVGYAVLDSDGRLRHNTLDRGYHKRNWWDRTLYKGRKWAMQTVLKEVS